MFLSKKKSRLVCNSYIEERYPGYGLLMDRSSRETYISLWGKGVNRIEVVFPRKCKGEVAARVAHYKIS